MAEDITAAEPADGSAPDITDLGNDVYQIDTKMAGYQGITAGYLIRGSRPCLVETGTAPSAPIVRDALASQRIVMVDGRILPQSIALSPAAAKALELVGATP